MTTIHPAYGGKPELVPFEGDRCELAGGEYLGIEARVDLLEVGDLVTFADARDANGRGAYYYDPRLLVKGSSYLRMSDKQKDKGRAWERITRQAPAAPACQE